MAEWLRRHPKQTEEERQDFVREVILKDIKVRNAGAEKWRLVQRNHPGTRYEEFKAWEEALWSKWLGEKMKSVKRKVERKKTKEAARKDGNRTASRQAPSSEGEGIMTTPSQATISPSSLRMSTPSIETPLASRQLASLDSFEKDDGAASSPLAARGLGTSLRRSSAESHHHNSKRRRTGNMFLRHMEDLMRDGYMAPDQVIELAMRIKAEQEGRLDVFGEIEESEAEAPPARSETASRHGRCGHLYGPVISQIPDPMDINETTSIRTPRSAARSEEISRMPDPMDIDKTTSFRTPRSATRSEEISQKLDPMDIDKTTSIGTPRSAARSEEISLNPATTLLPESLEPMEETESVSPSHETAPLDSDRADLESNYSRDDSPSISSKPSQARTRGESLGSPQKSRRIRDVCSSDGEDEGQSEDDSDIALEGPPGEGHGDEEEEAEMEEDDYDEGEEEEWSDGEGERDEEVEQEDDREEDGGGDTGRNEPWDYQDEDDDEEPVQEVPSKPRQSSRRTTDVFWDDDIDLDDFYFESRDSTKTPLEISGIEADAIPDPGVELLFPEDENVPCSPRLEAEDPPIELNLKEMGISDAQLGLKLYDPTTLFD